MKVILASASPRRRELMKLITEDFTAVAVDADETLPDNIEACDAAVYLARLKAEKAHEMFPDDLVIGCDTTVVCDNKVLGKPADKEQASEFMKMLSGNVHAVFTGCCIICGDKSCCFRVGTDVVFNKLSDDDIEAYISTNEPYDKAGGYGIQGKGALLVDRISGDFYNVVGLPVSRLNEVLKKFIKENNI